MHQDMVRNGSQLGALGLFPSLMPDNGWLREVLEDLSCRRLTICLCKCVMGYGLIWNCWLSFLERVHIGAGIGGWICSLGWELVMLLWKLVSLRRMIVWISDLQWSTQTCRVLGRHRRSGAPFGGCFTWQCLLGGTYIWTSSLSWQPLWPCVALFDVDGALIVIFCYQHHWDVFFLRRSFESWAPWPPGLPLPCCSLHPPCRLFHPAPPYSSPLSPPNRPTSSPPGGIAQVAL